MPGIHFNNVFTFGFFTYIVFFSYISVTSSVSFDLTELRNKVAKIKVNPRGNLWATGHFMGKKSVIDKDNPMLPYPNGQGDAFEISLNPEQNEIGEMFQEVLRMALKAQFDPQESRWKIQETGLLMKILESYIQNIRK